MRSADGARVVGLKNRPVLRRLTPSYVPKRPEPIRARYGTLLEVAESIAAHRQLSTLIADLSRRLKQLVSFDFMALTLLDPRSGTVSLHQLETERAVVGQPKQGLPVDAHRAGAFDTPAALYPGGQRRPLVSGRP
jgi:hypothetical protein